MLSLTAFPLSAQTIGFTQKTIASGLSLLRDVKIADMDNDGDPDILVTRGGGVDWFRNTDAKGTFSPTPVPAGVIFNANAAIAADIDGNGTVDVIVGAGSTSSNSEVALFKNLDTMGTNFGAKITLATLGDEIRDLIAADFDGDTDVDIVYASYETDQLMFLRNADGKGAFDAPVVYSAGNGIRFLDVADVDGDDDPDVFASAYFPVSSGQFSLYRNDGQGAFTYSAINNLDGNNAAAIAVADLDGDDDVDLVGNIYNSDRVYWYKNLDGSGMFGSRISVAADFNGPYTVNIADIEGDGDPDLVVASEVDNKLGFLLNNGQGVFGTTTTVPALLNFQNASFNASRLIASADMDKDGDADIVAISPGNNSLVWFKNAPPLTYTQQVVPPLCHGDSTGAIYLSVSGGEPPYTITWADTALQGDTLIGLPAGVYAVTIAESGGSQFVADIELTQPPLLEINLNGTPATTGSDNGTATVVVSGGTPPYEYIWSNGSNEAMIDSLTSGVYAVTVSDNLSCIAIDSIQVGMIDGVTDMLFERGVRLYPNPATDHVFFRIKNAETSINRIEISDVNGRSLIIRTLGGTIRQGVIPLPDFSPGLFVIGIYFSDGLLVRQKWVRW